MINNKYILNINIITEYLYLRMISIEIKKVEISQVEILREIAINTFSETFLEDNDAQQMQNYIDEKLSIKKLQEELMNEHSEFYFAKVDHQIIGYLKINIEEAQTENLGNRSMEVERIYVLQKHQGLKAGQALLNKSIVLAKEKRLEFIWLGVWENNKKAIQFYEKNGFVIFDKHLFLLGTEEQTDLMMKLKLN